MTDSPPDFAGLPESERRLLGGLLDGSGDDAESFGSPVDLARAQARLRNLREKYRDRLKRRRVEARAGLPVEPVETLLAWLDAIERADRVVRERLGVDQ